MLTLVMGKSASGKTTLVDTLVKKYGYNKVVTYTTRPKRPGETEGKDYYFVSKNEFDCMRQNKRFAESKDYHPAVGGTWSYGSVIPEEYLHDKKQHILIVTPAGAEDIKTYFGDAKDYITCIYLYVPENKLEKRLNARGDDPDEAKRRLKNDRKDFRGVENITDAVIKNDGTHKPHKQIRLAASKVDGAIRDHQAEIQEETLSTEISEIRKDVETLDI